MERGTAARGGAAGGGTIPTIRAELAYLVTGAAAALLVVAVGADAALSAPVAGGLLAIVAGLGVALLVAGVGIGEANLCYWGVGVVALTYVAASLRSASSDQAGVIVAIGLLASAELAGWSIDSRRRGLDDLIVHVHRLRAIALVLAAALGLAVITEAAANFGPGGTAAVALGVAAILAGVAATWRLTWKSGSNG